MSQGANHGFGPEPTVIYKGRWSADDANLLKNVLAQSGIDAQVVTSVIRVGGDGGIIGDMRRSL